MVRLRALVVVQDREQTGFAGARWRQYRALESAVDQLLDLLLLDPRQIGDIVVALSSVEEVTVRVLDFGVGHLVAEDFFIVLRVVQDVHHLLHVSLRSCGVFHLELVGDEVQPVLNLLLVGVSFVRDSVQDLDGFVEIVPGIVNFDHCPSEHGIPFSEELFAWSKSLHRCVAYGDCVIIFERGDLLLSHGLKDWLSILDASLLGCKDADHGDTVRYRSTSKESSRSCRFLGRSCAQDLLKFGFHHI